MIVVNAFRLATRHPGLEVAVSTIDESLHERRLRRGNLQLIVSVEPTSNHRLFSTVLCEDCFQLFAAPGSPSVYGAAASGAPLIYVPSARDRTGQTLQR